MFLVILICCFLAAVEKHMLQVVHLNVHKIKGKRCLELYNKRVALHRTKRKVSFQNLFAIFGFNSENWTGKNTKYGHHLLLSFSNDIDSISYIAAPQSTILLQNSQLFWSMKRIICAFFYFFSIPYRNGCVDLCLCENTFIENNFVNYPLIKSIQK